MVLPVAYGVFDGGIRCFCQSSFIFHAEMLFLSMDTVRSSGDSPPCPGFKHRVLSTAGHARRKRCYRHLVCCMTGLGYNPHTFSFIHNQLKAPTEDEGREVMFMKHLCVMLVALVATTANAQDFVVDGIFYNILSMDDKTVEVTNNPNDYEGDITIPSEVTYDGNIYTVTAIGDYAFSVCYALTSVEMPSVTAIGNNAFSACSALTSVKIPSATTIDDYAFNNCWDLTSIEMPEVITIGDWAFHNCKSMTSVEMPKVETIDERAFYLCKALRTVSMPSVKTIGDYAFIWCDVLKSVDMPSVTIIGERAFYNCDALISVSIPASCISIGPNPFENCDNLKEILVNENNPNYSSADGVLYDKDKTTLFSWPTAEGDIDIMPSVTTIGKWAFSESLVLTSVSMPSVTTIGDFAFNSCFVLTSVDMTSATTIGNEAFRGCYALTSVNIPGSVTAIGDYAFGSCTSLSEVYCHWQEPLECNPHFDTVTTNGTLYVPTGTTATYRSVYPWSEFTNIKERDYSAITDASLHGLSIAVVDGTIVISGCDGTAPAPMVEVYSAGGKCVYRGTKSSIGGLPHGVYVVKVGDVTQKVAL